MWQWKSRLKHYYHKTTTTTFKRLLLFPKYSFLLLKTKTLKTEMKERVLGR